MWIYQGSAYAYANDPDFARVSQKQDYWQEVIDKYNSKYNGIYNYQSQLIEGVYNTSGYTSPFGRNYLFMPNLNPYSGEVFSKHAICNWINQGLGADVVQLIRIQIYKYMRLLKGKGKLSKTLMVNTVHDSIDFDTVAEEKPLLMNIVNRVFSDLPKIIKATYNVSWNIPMTFELK